MDQNKELIEFLKSLTAEELTTAQKAVERRRVQKLRKKVNSIVLYAISNPRVRWESDDGFQVSFPGSSNSSEACKGYVGLIKYELFLKEPIHEYGQNSSGDTFVSGYYKIISRRAPSDDELGYSLPTICVYRSDVFGTEEYEEHKTIPGLVFLRPKDVTEENVNSIISKFKEQELSKCSKDIECHQRNIDILLQEMKAVKKINCQKIFKKLVSLSDCKTTQTKKEEHHENMER